MLCFLIGLWAFVGTPILLTSSDLANFGGVVLDSHTLTPVPSARVILELWSQSEPQTTFTNSLGVFSFKVAAAGKSWPGRILVYDPNHLRLAKSVDVSNDTRTQDILIDPVFVTSVQSEQRVQYSQPLESFAGANWSQWVELCALAGNNEQIGVAQFHLEGDRTCGGWSECRETVHDSTRVCWQFRFQGHDEWRGPFGIAIPRAGVQVRGSLVYQVHRNVQTPPPEGKSGTVAIQYAGSEKNAVIEAIGASLTRNGFRLVNVERIDKKYQSSVQYFHDEDKVVAQQVLGLVATSLANTRGISPPTAQIVTGEENKARLRYVEIWLH
jgi:hypothetical protein